MDEKIPSPSAKMAAMSRAAHLVMDDEPKIFRDTFALRFSDMPDETTLITTLDAFFNELGVKINQEFANGFKQSYRASVAVKQRYTEDELNKALERGVSQYVILGAGLDSFAYRRRDLANRLRVYEVDHPGSQLWKKARLRALNVELPHNLTFVPVDFEKQNLLDELRSAGCQLDIPIYFSMLAVTQFLTEMSVYQTLKGIASLAAGSEIVFSYLLLDSLLEEGDQLIVTGGKRRAEPWISQFDPVTLTKRLVEMGYTEVWDFGPEDAINRYLSGRTDELSPSALNRLYASTLRIEHIMKAKVSGRIER